MKATVLFATATALLCMVGPAFAQAEHAEAFRGRVEISTTDAGDVQIVLDSASGQEKPDGIADHLFILQREADGVELLHSFETAIVIFAPDRMAVRTPDFEVRLVVATTTGAADDRPGPRTVFGYGLSHHFGEFDVSIEELSSRAFFPDAGELPSRKWMPDGGGFLDCNSGGVGAEECGVTGCEGYPTSCSVICQTGYWACCWCENDDTGASCRCIGAE